MESLLIMTSNGKTLVKLIYWSSRKVELNYNKHWNMIYWNGYLIDILINNFVPLKNGNSENILKAII